MNMFKNQIINLTIIIILTITKINLTSTVKVKILVRKIDTISFFLN